MAWMLAIGLHMRIPDHGLSLRAETVLTILGVGCLIGSVVFLLIGAHAAGLAMLGALHGAAVGFAVIFPLGDPDPVLSLVAYGASIGTVVFGFLGLRWKAGASPSVLRTLAVVSLIVGVLAVITIQVSAVPVCHRHDDPRRCLDTSDGPTVHYVTGSWLQALVGFDATFIVVLLLLQAGQATRRPIGMNEPRQGPALAARPRLM